MTNLKLWLQMVILCKYFGLTWGAETNRRWDCVCFTNHRILSPGTYCCLSIFPQISLVNIFSQGGMVETKLKPNAAVGEWQAYNA